MKGSTLIRMVIALALIVNHSRAQTFSTSEFKDTLAASLLDSNRVDFSMDFLKGLQGSTSYKPSVSPSLKRFDYSPVWLEKTSMDGVFGKEYTRIRFKFLEITKDKKSPLIYHLKGKSRLRTDVFPFEGTIHLIRASLDSSTEENPLPAGTLIAAYEFRQDSALSGTGIFSGIVYSLFTLDSGYHHVLTEFEALSADAAMSSTFVGTWKPYQGKKASKCIWGDGRLPYTFDFDIGTGEMVVNPRYLKNGWESFGNFDKEYVELKNGEVKEKEEWWLSN